MFPIDFSLELSFLGILRTMFTTWILSCTGKKRREMREQQDRSSLHNYSTNEETETYVRPAIYFPWRV